MENLPAKVNICPDWTIGNYCIIALKDDYLRHSCRVCIIANECWPGIHEGSIHSMQSGQSVIRKEKKEA